MSELITENFARLTEFQQIILNYYKENPRDFRWRQTTDPYEILVSEIMLQQTQTERVVPKYDEWLAVFPDVFSLAYAPLSKVLQLWSGLGYNRRALFLQTACKIICEISKGVFPETAQELEKLPGIGHYTARAVITFAFNKSEVFIETNIRSVFLFFFFKDSEEKIDDKLIFPLVKQSLYCENPRIWYYALMDYGVALKKKVKNPNHKSAQYVKQSKFEGSHRQARGAILRTLAEKNDFPLKLSQISTAESIEYERLLSAADSLCAEGFIYREDDLYRICQKLL